MLRTKEDITNQFGYHKATSETGPLHDSIRKDFITFAKNIYDVIPDGPEKTIVMRKLQEALMYTNLAVALTAPLVDGSNFQ